MARTQAADYGKKRLAITEHAAKLFAERGFVGASISDLASVCGVSKSLIYHYYASKEAILFDVMNDHVEALQAALDRVDASDPPDAQLRALSRSLLDQYVGAADSQKVLLYELPSLPAEERQAIIEKQRTLLDRVESLLGALNPDLAADHGRMRVKVMLYFGMLNWTHTWYRPTGPVARDELADMAAETILCSLKAD